MDRCAFVFFRRGRIDRWPIAKYSTDLNALATVGRIL